MEASGLRPRGRNRTQAVVTLSPVAPARAAEGVVPKAKGQRSGATSSPGIWLGQPSLAHPEHVLIEEGSDSGSKGPGGGVAGVEAALNLDRRRTRLRRG